MVHDIDNYLLCCVKQKKFFDTNGHKHFLIQTPYQWLYNPIIKKSTIGYVKVTFGNVIKTLKYLPKSQLASVTILYYKLADQSTSGLDRFLECRKCNILVITQALMLCLIHMHSSSGAACPRKSCIYIRQSTLACVITYTYRLATYRRFTNWPYNFFDK